MEVLVYNTTISSHWWLRSPSGGGSYSYAQGVYNNGSLNSFNKVITTDYSVLPAFRINR
jgi:hypothetical protein